MSSTGRANERARFERTVALERDTWLTENIKAKVWLNAQIELERAKAEIWLAAKMADGKARQHRFVETEPQEEQDDDDEETDVDGN